MSGDWNNSILRNHGAVNLEQSDVDMCSQPQQLFSMQDEMDNSV
jgi:hypothetical protein